MTGPAAVLDHLVVAAHTLDQGSAYVQDCLGVPMTGGGKHAAMGTHNRVLRVRAKITSQNWRSDLVQVWSIQVSKTTGIASYFEDFENEASAKDELKQRCKNVKLFLREP